MGPASVGSVGLMIMALELTRIALMMALAGTAVAIPFLWIAGLL